MSTPVAPVLDVAGASLVRGSALVLDRLSLVIASGEHTAILGPNGAGKSSLIRLLTFEDYPLAAADAFPPPVRWFGHDRWDVVSLRSRLGLVSGDLDANFARATRAGRVAGLEAVVSGLLASHAVFDHHRVTDPMWRAAEAALSRVGAAHLARTPLTDMSAGEKRRVLIARALVTRPAVLLLDEPTTGLDFVARHRFMETIRGLCGESTTIILVTHHVEEVIPEMRRVVLLRAGRIVHDGDAEDVLTSQRLSEAYGARLRVSRNGHYYRVHVDD